MSKPNATRPRLVILISGSGSNLQAFIDATQQQRLAADICLVISNKPGAKGLERAARANLPTAIVDHKQFAAREDFDRALMQRIDAERPDAVILAGFMRILTPAFVEHYLGRLFNIHPSLLPKYPGIHTHQRALDNGDTEAGATVHFVVPELDAGPMIIQARVPILPGDDADTLAKRVLAREHVIYPLAVTWFCDKRLQLLDNCALLDGKPLPSTGYLFQDALQ